LCGGHGRRRTALCQRPSTTGAAQGSADRRSHIEPADLIRPGQAQRLAEAREASGRESGELAALLNISFEAYRDLEWFDEEIVDVLSFDQLLTLATAIKLELRHFFDAGDLGQLTFAELATRLESSATDSASLAALEEKVGWELGKHLEDPSTFGELPAIALADIGKFVGVDWRSLLPP
jgi:hypothetical protein